MKVGQDEVEDPRTLHSGSALNKLHASDKLITCVILDF